MKFQLLGASSPEESVRERAHRAIAREAAAEGIVLLENNGVLPMQPQKIALYGAGSRMTVKGAVQLRNICDVRFDAAISVRTTSEKPLTAPPAGATIITLPPVMPIAA